MDALCALPSWQPGPATVALHHLVDVLTYMLTASRGGAAYMQILHISDMFFSSAFGLLQDQPSPVPPASAASLAALLTALLMRMARALAHDDIAALPVFAHTRSNHTQTPS